MGRGYFSDGKIARRCDTVEDVVREMTGLLIKNKFTDEALEKFIKEGRGRQ